MEITTFLFDLDGTLLPIDFDSFLEDYFRALTSNFTDVAEPELFTKYLFQATEEMINNTGKRMNKEVFMESFFSLIEFEEDQALVDRFDAFYQEEFPRLGKGLEVSPAPSRIIEHLKGQGYQLVIATNPLFPREAVVERMKWGNLSPRDFALITHYENMHYSKPGLDFYREILNRLDLNPDECVMVGNDMQEDMVAGRLGMATYLVEDYLIDRGTGDLQPDWRGTVTELEGYLRENFPTE